MSLANKYRPKKWEEVVGQPHITKLLRSQIERGRFNSSYLFLGGAGTGKTTQARIFANEINGVEGAYTEIDAASYNGADDMRNLVESAQSQSVGYKYKIFILDEAHALSSAGWSVLLKTLEESPKYTIFILCTTELNKVPETIKSRSLVLRVLKVGQDDIRKQLDMICTKENVSVSEDIVEYIARSSGGGLRSAISKLEQVIEGGISTLDEARLALSLEVDEIALDEIVCAVCMRQWNVVSERIAYLHSLCFGAEEIRVSILNYIVDLLRYAYTKDFRFTGIWNQDTVSKRLDSSIYDLKVLRMVIRRLFGLENPSIEVLLAQFMLLEGSI